MMRAGLLSKQLDYIADYNRPKFPLSGGDIVAASELKGPAIGQIQRQLEEEWVNSGFALDRDALLARIPEIAATE